MENIESLIKLYRKDTITDYVMERELTRYLGEDTTVRLIEKPNKNLNKSFCIFPIPERLVEGFHIVYFVDKDALKVSYDVPDIILILARVKSSKQDIFMAYNKFIRRNESSDISYGMALGFLLDLYLTFRISLDIRSDIDLLPEEEKIRDISVKANNGEYKPEDREALLIINALSNEVLEFAKKYVKTNPTNIGGPRLVLVSDADMIPSVNLGQQEIMAHCTSTFGIRQHTEIPENYKPETNQ